VQMQHTQMQPQKDSITRNVINSKHFQRRCGTCGTKPFAQKTAYVNQSLKNWIRSLACAELLQIYFGSWCFGGKSLHGFERTCIGVHEKRVNIKMAIIMAATITPSSTATQVARPFYETVIQQIVRELASSRCDASYWWT